MLFDQTKADSRKGEAGFSLMETAIAMVLLAIIGLGIASVFFYAAKNNVSAGDRQLAMAVAQQRMEQLRNLVFTDANLAAVKVIARLELIGQDNMAAAKSGNARQNL